MDLEKIIEVKLSKLYSFLFIFMSINREFKPLDLDIRYFILVLGFLLLIWKILKNGKKIFADFNSQIISICIFYMIIFFSNIFIFFFKNTFDIFGFINMIILHINNLLAIVIYFLCRDELINESVYKYILFSLVTLFLSVIMIYMNISLTSIISKEYLGFVSGLENYNAFGQNIRISGFAEDPNYATFFFIIGIIICIFYKRVNILIRFLFILFYFFGLLLSWSKTGIIAIIISLCIYFIMEWFSKYSFSLFDKKIKLDYFMLTLGLIVVFLLFAFVPFININITSDSLSNRFIMWDCAQELFAKNPIFGSGITSFRNYFLNTGNWYVQCHSTYLQILSECGIIGAISFIVIIIFAYRRGNSISKILLYTYLIWALNFETIYLQVFVIIMFILPNVLDVFEHNGNRILFFINSFGQGGAERVCINLAEGYIKKGYDIDFITLYDDDKYQINKSFNVFTLGLHRKDPKVCRLLGMIAGLYKMDKFIKLQNKKSSYSLITSHLPFSNIISRLSIVSKECLYVMHIPCSSFSIINDKIYGYILKTVFINRKIVTVSNGVKDEMVTKYKFSTRQIHTIYNPLLLEDIEKKVNESLDYKKPYLLFVGRLIGQKRVDRLLEVYKRGNFYKKYNLVLVGNGDEFESVKEYVNELQLNEYVDFVGWQDNVYKWMKNAEILLSTSDFEAFPMGLIEAFACDCKVVSANCEYGPSEILIDEYKKYLVNDITNINEYIEKINLALKEYPIPKNNKIINLCNLDTITKQYINYYKQ